MQQIYFTPYTTDFLNPERGPFVRVNLTSDETQYDYVRNIDGCSLVKAMVYLGDCRDVAIPQSRLDEIDTQLGLCRDAGIKCILEFYYATEGEEDASESWIGSHINQLKYILEKHVDIIACMYMGFIGWWGEGHNSSNNLDNTISRRNILFTLDQALPVSRMILIRCPWWKYDILGNWLHDHVNQAFTGTRLARYGHHNDGILAPNWGYGQGTYPHEAPTQQWIDGLFGEAPYVACGGESSYLGSLVTCENADYWLEGAHYNFLSKVWRPDVIAELTSQGCWDEILKRLGYRFALTSATLPEEVVPGDTFNFHLELTNEGYASMYNERPVFLVLEKDPIRYNLPICDFDPRWWFPGDHELDASIIIPEGAPDGNYGVSLWLPDSSPSIRNDARYAIRFANDGIWNDGMNYLGEMTVHRGCP